MKSAKIHLSILIAALFVLSGCYTSFKTVMPTELIEAQGYNQVAHISNGMYEVDGAYYYIDYATRHWYSTYGISLAKQGNILNVVAHGYHPPASSYFYSPALMRAASSRNLPVYNNTYIVPGVYHPPYYSNPYLYSFFYNKWAQWYYWDSEGPNSWCNNPYQLSAFYGSNLPCEGVTNTSTASVSQGNYANERNRILRDQTDRLIGDRTRKVESIDIQMRLTDNRLGPRERLAEKDSTKNAERSFGWGRNVYVLNTSANLPEGNRSIALRGQQSNLISEVRSIENQSQIKVIDERLRTPRTEILRERMDNFNIEPLTTNDFRLSPRDRIKIDYWQKLADGRVSSRRFNTNVDYTSSANSSRSSVNSSGSASTRSINVDGGSSRSRTGSSTTRENSSTSGSRGNNR